MNWKGRWGILTRRLKEKPKISVIIPAYNIEQYLERCLESVSNQTYKNLQVIIIDDGSTDGTGRIAELFSQKDGRFEVIHKKNGGVSAARKSGLDIADGEYIGFVDGDDCIEAEMYQKLMNLSEEYKADIAHCGYQMVFPDRVDMYHGTEKLKIQDTYTGVRDLLEGELVEPGLGNKLYSRELFDGIEYNEDIVINEDLLLNFYLFHRSGKSVFYDYPFYHYMIRKNSASISEWNEKKLLDPVCVLEIMIENESDRELKKILINRYTYQLVRCILFCSDTRKEVLKKHQKDLQKKLKKVLHEMERGYISRKNYWMAQITLKCRWGMRLMHWVHGVIKRTNSKYRIREV